MFDQHFAILALAGGIALFLMGMELLSEGLRKCAGARMTAFLGRMTSGRVRGAGAGAVASTLIHTGPATVIILGYVNAGIITLSQSLPVLFGANIGTTLSMQIVAFNIGKYCFAILAAGVLLRRFATRDALRHPGMILVGFGLLFLGLDTMKMAFEPLRDSTPVTFVLTLFEQSSLWAYFAVFAASIVVTAIFQSSGVVLSLLFTLATLGVLNDFRFSIPFILGAHIGSCGMTVLSAIGSGVSVWRGAIAHVLFNIAGAAVATLLIPVWGVVIPAISQDVTRQVANFNTLKQALCVILFLPLTPAFERAAVFLTRGMKSDNEEISHLDPSLLATPENAILAVISELGRQARIVRTMLMQSLDGLVSLDLRKFRSIHAQEKAVDTIKHKTQSYIHDIASHNLSGRQTLMLQRLVIASNAIERIGDHVEDIGYLSREKITRDVWFPDEQMNALLRLSGLVCEMMETALHGIDPAGTIATEQAARALDLRTRFKSESDDLKTIIKSSAGDGESNAASVLLFLRHVYILDKIVSHLKALARQERGDEWEVHLSGLNRVEELAPKPEGRPPEHVGHETFAEALETAERDQPIPPSQEST